MPMRDDIAWGFEKAISGQGFANSMRQVAAFFGLPVAARTIGHAAQAMGDPTAGPLSTMQNLTRNAQAGSATFLEAFGGTDIAKEIRAGLLQGDVLATTERRIMEEAGEWAFRGGKVDENYIKAMWKHFYPKYEAAAHAQAGVAEWTRRKVEKHPIGESALDWAAYVKESWRGFIADPGQDHDMSVPEAFRRLWDEMKHGRHADMSSGKESRRGRLGWGSPVDD